MKDLRKTDPVVAYTVVLSAVARDVSEFCLCATGIIKSKGHMSAMGARVLQFVAAEYERLVRECDGDSPSRLPAEFRENIDRLVERTQAKAEAAIAADELAGFTATPGGVS